MPEMASFITLTKRALRLTWGKRSLWWVAIPTGVLVGINSTVAGTLQELLPEASEASHWLPLLTNPKTLTVFGFVFATLLGQSFIRGALVFILDKELRDEKSPDRKDILSKIFRAASTSTLFEIVYWTMLLLIVIALSLPCFLAWRFNPSVLPIIVELGFLLTMTIGVYLYFIKELAVFYAILGSVRFQLAIDLGFRLFRRQSLNTVLFFFYVALLALFFSMLVGSLMAGIGVSQKDSSWPITLIMALPFGFYFIFDQTIRLLFFRTIATSPNKPVAEKVVKASEQPSGMTPS